MANIAGMREHDMVLQNDFRWGIVLQGE